MQIDLLDEEEKQLKQALALSLKEVSPLGFDHSYTTGSINVEEDANNNAAWNTVHAEMDTSAGNLALNCYSLIMPNVMGALYYDWSLQLW